VIGLCGYWAAVKDKSFGTNWVQTFENSLWVMTIWQVFVLTYLHKFFNIAYKHNLFRIQNQFNAILSFAIKIAYASL